MVRLVAALAAWVGVVSAAPATLAPRRDRPPFGEAQPHFQAARATAAALSLICAGARATDYVVTGETEVLLNGKPCRYEDIPDDATILRMELGADNKTVLKLYFRVGTSPRR